MAAKAGIQVGHSGRVFWASAPFKFTKAAGLLHPQKINHVIRGNTMKGICKAAILVLTSLAFGAAWGADGEDLTIINKTGTSVVVFVMQDDNVHLNPKDGVQWGALKNGASGVAHVPNCHFGILLVDKDDVWHAEFHDCNSSSITFTATTGRAKRAGK